MCVAVRAGRCKSALITSVFTPQMPLTCTGIHRRILSRYCVSSIIDVEHPLSMRYVWSADAVMPMLVAKAVQLRYGGLRYESAVEGNRLMNTIAVSTADRMIERVWGTARDGVSASSTWNSPRAGRQQSQILAAVCFQRLGVTLVPANGFVHVPVDLSLERKPLSKVSSWDSSTTDGKTSGREGGVGSADVLSVPNCFPKAVEVNCSPSSAARP
mmetsp:Transcript_61726/g.127533  ORF Transcript_61726/g.127533 Transcript_61726/m.127533 type:complete len:214 (-) Transcript_61726:2363-3004(-)